MNPMMYLAHTIVFIFIYIIISKNLCNLQKTQIHLWECAKDRPDMLKIISKK